MIENNDKEALDFAGFPDAGVAPESSRSSVKKKPGARPPRSTENQSHAAPSTKTPGGSGAVVLFWRLFFVFCGIMLFAIFFSAEDGRESRRTNSPVPVEVRTPVAATPPAITRPTEQPPPIGAQILTRDQVRWCVFWDARIDRLAKMVVDDPLFSSFNRVVEDYNSRCQDARYYENDMRHVRSELGVRQAEIEGIVNEIYRDWAQRYLAPIVRDIQRDLTELGYQPGPIDGIPGPQTRGAIRQLEQDYGVEPTGIASMALRDFLREITDQQ